MVNIQWEIDKYWSQSFFFFLKSNILLNKHFFIKPKTIIIKKHNFSIEVSIEAVQVFSLCVREYTCSFLRIITNQIKENFSEKYVQWNKVLFMLVVTYLENKVFLQAKSKIY